MEETPETEIPLGQTLESEANQILSTLTPEEKALIEFPDVPVVFSSGSDPRIMVIARDLGKTEVTEGFPLVGDSGMLFRSMVAIANAGDYVYCTNTVPFKPIDNKEFPESVRKKFLQLIEKQYLTISPRVVITLGRTAFETVNWSDKITVPIIPLHHPSYFYRNGLRVPVTIRNAVEKCKPKIYEQFQSRFLYPFLQAMEIADIPTDKPTQQVSTKETTEDILE